MTCSVVEGPVMAHGSLGEELSTTGTEELELLSEEESEDREGAGLWQNLGPMIILGWGILRPSDRLSQQ